MDLRTGLPVWLETDPDVVFPPLDAATDADVVVVGGGVTGALVAYRLLEAGIRPVVLDRRQPGRGSTVASTALLLYEPDTPLAELERRLGAPRAAQAYLACRAAIDRLAQLAAATGDCAFRRTPSLYLASTQADVEALRVEVEGRARLGFDVELLDRAALYARWAVDRPAGIVSRDAAELDPYRFTLALLSAIVAGGGSVHGGTEAARVEPDGHGVRVTTRDGAEVRARCAVLAAGYETPRFLPRPVVSLKSTYVAAGRPSLPEPWADGAPVAWETSRPYLYVRTTADGRLLVGGGDESFADPESRDALIGAKAGELVRAAAALLPDAGVLEPEFAWAGTFGQTADSLPYAGAIPEVPGALFALAYGANGLVFASIAADLLAARVAGHEHPDAALFGFDR
jgi:glycine/D-amino acid oxidase-like deaminating enzyme